MCCRGLSEDRKLYLGLFRQYFSCQKLGGGGGGGGQYWLIRHTKNRLQTKCFESIERSLENDCK